MTPRIDPSLSLASPVAPGALQEVDSALALAGQARAEPYLLEGARVQVRGTERGGGADVHVDGFLVLEDLRCDAGVGVNVVVTPSLLRREWVGSHGTPLETVFALPTLPMAAFQWSGGDALGVSFTVLPGHRDLRYNAGRRNLRAEPAAADHGVEVVIHPDPEAWQVAEGGGGGIEVHVRLSAPGPATLLVAWGDAAATARALEAGRHLAAHALRAAADQDPSNVERLLTRTGVAELDQAVGWATVRLSGALRRGDPVGPDDWFWAGVGALASGDAPGALLAADRVRETAEVSVWPGAPAPGPALSAFLAARATLLSGDEAPAQRTLASLGPAALEDARSASDPRAWAWWSLALTTLADALRFGAADDEIQALRDLALRPAGRAGRGRPLPMVGTAAPDPGSAPWLRALLRGDGLTPRGEGDAHAATSALTPWGALASGDVDGGYSAWRTTLARGLAGAWGARGRWDPPGRGGASVLATLAFGLLGLEPDAPSGRIRVAPALPVHLRDFRVRGIRVGGARLELAYGREGPVHRFHLNALDGRVPPMVILEPSLAMTAVGAVRVDGAPAELTGSPAGARTRFRVQIPVDGPRLLEIEEG